jgi:uncharacterized protein (TIGR04255 family)
MSEAYKLNDPPVVETVLGIQFSRLARLTNESMLAFARSCAGNWPNVDVVRAVAEQFESFGQQPSFTAPAGPKDQQGLPIRLQLRNTKRDRMLQFQPTKLYYNWIRTDLGDYPSYGRIRPSFLEEYTRFQDFLTEGEIGTISPNQWELTYVNRIPRGRLWQEVPDIENVLPGAIGSARPMNPLRLERIDANWAFEIQPQRGRLHAGIQSQRYVAPGQEEAIILRFTARGPLSKGSDLAALTDGLDFGHEAIIAAFRSMTSRTARKQWGEESSNDTH